LATWDVFHSDRLELRRSLATAEVRAALASGELRDDDLIRPAGTTTPWARIGDMPALLGPEPESEPAPEPVPGPPAPAPPPGDDRPPVFLDDLGGDEDDFEILETDDGSRDGVRLEGDVSPFDEAEHDTIPDPSAGAGAYGEFDLSLRDAGAGAGRGPGSSAELVAAGDDGLEFVDEDGAPVEDEEEYDPLEEDEAVAEFTLSRNRPERVEELDLAAMVDVAFQLVLFFLVTATTVLYKSLEVPKPNPESSPTAAAQQGRSKSLDELKDDFILVEIDPSGAVKIDHEPVPADLGVLAERLRAERERTRRQSMLLSADFATPHRSAVLAYDAANEIGLAIAIARPSPK
jgi:biopolymer transport protein ExbD